MAVLFQAISKAQFLNMLIRIDLFGNCLGKGILIILYFLHFPGFGFI